MNLYNSRVYKTHSMCAYACMCLHASTTVIDILVKVYYIFSMQLLNKMYVQLKILQDLIFSTKCNSVSKNV